MPGPRTDSFATFSFVAGILSVVVCLCWPFFVVPVAGIVFGILSLNRIGKQPDRYAGRGLALAGIVLGALCLVMMAIALVVFATADYVEPSDWNDSSGRYY